MPNLTTKMITEERERKIYNHVCFASIVSMIAIIISIISLLIWKCNYTPMTWNLVDVIVAVLSILVTLLIGWQIFNTLTITSKVKRASNLSKKIANEIERYKHITKSFAQTLHTKGIYEQDLPRIAIDGFMTGLNEGIKGEDKDAINFALQFLNYIMNDCKNKTCNGEICKGKKAEYLRILSTLSPSQNSICNTDELLTFISNAIEVEPDSNKNERVRLTGTSETNLEHNLDFLNNVVAK